MIADFSRLASRAFNTPLLFHPAKAETIIEALGPRLLGGAVIVQNGTGGVDHTAFENGRPSAGRIGDRLGRAFDKHEVVPFDVVEGVAIIPIEGTLIHKGAWVGASSGETSYQGLQVQVARATAKDKIKGIVFEVDSFGGQVSGAFETAEAIAAASKAKPTLAILTDFAYSAGYLLASQARQIVMPEFGGAGSIGVITMHADFSRQIDNAGVKVTIQTAGQYKAAGHPFLPLDDDTYDKTQALIEAMRDRFAETVGKGRRGRMSKAKALSTEAKDYTGQAAVDVGLVDAIADPATAFNAFIKEINKKG